MKILQVGKFYPIIGGVEKVMYDIVESMSERVDMCCDMLCASKNRHGEIIRINHAKIVCTPTWMKAFATMISPRMIIRLCQIKSDYDIIQIHHPDPMAAFALWLSNYKGKIILHWHADVLKQKLALFFYKPLQNWLIKRADVIVGTTPKYLEASPFLQDKSLKKICIPIGIDPVRYDREKVKLLRNKYEGKKLIFSLGRLVEYKGYEYLVDAARYLPDDYLVLIGGSGPLKESLDNRIVQNSLQEKVQLLGRVSDEDLPTYYAACDVYVMSSIWKTEAFGIVQIEAMSCGKPVVATKISGSGVDWVNEDGVSGINVKPMDGKAIADAVMQILSDEKKYAKFSKGAKERYEKLFRKETMINRFSDLYKSLMDSCLYLV